MTVTGAPARCPARSRARARASGTSARSRSARYALCIILGIVAAIWIGERRWVARGGRPGRGRRPRGLGGAVRPRRRPALPRRSPTAELYFGDGSNPVTALYVWRGGLGIWGAIALGRARRRSSAPGARASSSCRSSTRWRPGVLVAQAIGRWGNWFNQELFGRPTDLPWALEIDAAHRPAGLPRRARRSTRRSSTSASGTSAPFGVLIWADRRFRLGHGRVFALYVMAYTLGPRLDRDAPHRRRPARRRARPAAQRVDLDRAVRRSPRRTSSWSRAAPPRPRGARSTSRPSDEPPSEADAAQAGRRRRAPSLRPTPRTTSDPPAAALVALTLRSGQCRPCTATWARRRPWRLDRRSAQTTTGEPMPMHAFPPPQGLYDPRHEHDACGVAFVATLTGEASHDIVAKALTALRNLDHRGAAGAEPNSGDGAGILIQVPDAFLRAVAATPASSCPPPARTPSAPAFLPGDDEQVAKTRTPDRGDRRRGGPGRPRLARGARRPRAARRDRARRDAAFSQLFVAGAGAAGRPAWRWSGWPSACASAPSSETDVYFPSLSSRTLVYKGMLTTDQLDPFFPDLADERIASALAVVHSRFSTNTFPSWPLAHPFRFIAHNGEINTVMGNRNWMRAREALLASDLIPGDLDRLFPICTPGASDSASFDEVLELLHMGGRSLPHAVLMMIPEAWENHAEMDAQRRAVLRVPLRADGAVGRPGVRRLHRRHPDRRGARPQRPAPVAATGSPTTGWSCWPPRSACSTSTRPPSSARAGCSRAGCSSSTPTSTGSSRTTRSRPSSPPSTRTTSGCTPA